MLLAGLFWGKIWDWFSLKNCVACIRRSKTFFQNLEWEVIDRPRWMEEARQAYCLLKTGGGCCMEAFLGTGKPFHFEEEEAGSESKKNQRNARQIETDWPLGTISFWNSSPEVRKEFGAESELRLLWGGMANKSGEVSTKNEWTQETNIWLSKSIHKEIKEKIDKWTHWKCSRVGVGVGVRVRVRVRKVR